jgi:dipeptidyl aminopeptidase/acylaminoacyl peptidase
MTSRCSLYPAALLALLCAMPPVLAQTAAAPPAIESFFANQQFGGALLSPSSRYLAARTGGPGRHDVLVVIDLDTHKPQLVAGYSDADIGEFQWVNDERLVYNVTDKAVGPGDEMYGPGLFAVNRDGSGKIQLADRRGKAFITDGGSHLQPRKLLPWHTFLMDQQGARDSQFIYVTSPEFDNRHEFTHVRLLRLDTVTGRAEPVPRPKGPVRHWMLDQKGEPRLAVGTEGNTATIYYREPSSGEWRTLASYPAYTGGGRSAIDPIGFGAGGTLYVEARGDSDTTALYTFNFSTGKVNPEPVLVTEGYDFHGRLVANQDKLLGVRFRTDAEGTLWFDPAMKAVQQKVDALLPGTVNLLAVPARPAAPWVLVRSYSDMVPATYTLYNTQTGLLDKVGDSHPHIDSRQMARQDMVRYKARDGLPVPALLTLPRNGKGKKLPLVMLVHGGPWVRGAVWGWNPQSQFLASRGYAVLEPEYRGSTGFGARHFMAGWKQWGLAMQNDIADGARWAVAQGIADPKRICIAGASYGGYATLMGLVNDPDLYKCGVDWAGVTDINLMYTGTWLESSDISDDFKAYGMPAMIGDQVKDAAQLKATSPIEQAARIRQPVLLAYGGVDRRVPMFHGRRFYEAVKHTNRNVEWIEYPEEAHGWVLEKNKIDFWSRVEKFLDKNIGKGAVQE